MTGFIIRVDVFEVEGKLKVNEFESFEALFTSVYASSRASKRKGAKEVSYWDDFHSTHWCEEFWYNKMKQLISTYLAVTSNASSGGQKDDSDTASLSASSTTVTTSAGGEPKPKRGRF
jgi:hypothetical protein